MKNPEVAGIPSYNVQLVRDGAIDGSTKELLNDSAKVAKRLGYMKREVKERVVAMFLNSRHQPIGVNTVSIGTLTASLIHPREVFQPALLAGAASVIIAHNHPSGDPTPSPEDGDITRRLKRAGDILGVPLLDHIVIATDGYFSFRERGMMPS